MQNDSVVQRFQVEPIDGQKNYVTAEYNKDKGGFTYEVKKEDFGFMVYFPAGHSIRVRDEAELKRLGFDRVPGKVDMENGEEVEPDMDNSPKAIVQRQTQRRAVVKTDD